MKRWQPYSEAGWIASDNYDAKISVIKQGTFINSDIPGDYEINYIAFDLSGNMDEKTRFIHVEESNSWINRQIAETSFSVHPQPAESYVIIQSAENISHIELKTLQGKMIQTFNFSNPNDYIRIDTQNLVPGLYMASLLIGNRTYNTRLSIAR